MNIFEMMRSGELHPMWFGVIIQGIALATLCFVLAKSKNRNKLAACIVGFVPVVNYLAVFYYVGMPKLDKANA